MHIPIKRRVSIPDKSMQPLRLLPRGRTRAGDAGLLLLASSSSLARKLAPHPQPLSPKRGEGSHDSRPVQKVVRCTFRSNAACQYLTKACSHSAFSLAGGQGPGMRGFCSWLHPLPLPESSPLTPNPSPRSGERGATTAGQCRRWCDAHSDQTPRVNT